MNSEPLQEAFLSRPIVRIGPQYTEVQAHLQHLSLDDSAGGLASLELRLDSVVTDTTGRDTHPYDDDRILSLGAEVYVGMTDQLRPKHSMFQGRVTAIEAVWGEGSPSVVVLVEDALQRLRMTRRTKVHENLRLPTLVQSLCSDLELRDDVVGFDDSLGTQVQLNESDLAFLRRLVHERDGELQVIEGKLQILKVSALRRGTVRLDVAGKNLRCRVRADLAHQVSEITLSGWDVTQGQRIAVTSQFNATGPGQGTDGAAMLQRALRYSRKEHLGHVPVADQNEAQAVVDAMHARRARQFVTLEVTAPGDPRLRVGTHVELVGAGDRFDNTYLIVETHHRMDRVSGYETTFVAECAFLGAV